jgi:small nuclear ribonucleoprotein E
MTDAAPNVTEKRVKQTPDHVIHSFLKEKQKVRVWLMHDNRTRIEGVLVGYDEFMNLILENASEINCKSGSAVPIGKIILRGDTVGLIHAVGL